MHPRRGHSLPGRAPKPSYLPPWTFAIAIALTPGLAHVAAAQAGWSSSITDIGPSQTGVFPFGHLVAGPNGDAVAVWPDGKWSLVAARYSGTSKKWNAAVTLSTPARQAYYPRVAINGSGNALAVWSEADSLNPGRQELWFAGYAPTTNTWTERALLATNGSQPDVALDAAGNAIAVWLEPEPTNTIRTARYDANAGTWTPSIELGRSRLGARMVVDNFGNATVVWQQSGLRAAKFQATTNAWATTTDLANGSYNASVAVDGSGTVIVVYQAVGGLYAVWSEAQGLTWTTPVHVSTLEYPDWVGIAVGTDAAGNAVVLWVEYPDFESAGPVRTRTFDIATRSWSTVEELAPNGYSHPALTVDRAGNAAVAWANDQARLVTVRRPVGGSWTALLVTFECDQPYIAADGRGNITLLWQRIGRMFSTRWQAEPAAPTVNRIDSGNGSVIIDFSPPAALEPAFASQNVEHSLDDGVTWTARTPSSMHSPLAVSGLSNGQLHQLRLRVVNAAGHGTASQPETTVAGLGSPRLLDPAVSGQTVTLRWTAPSGFSPTSYLLEAGSTPGDTLASLHSTETTLTVVAPTGVFYVRVRALVGKTRSPASNEMPLVVGVPAVPSAPVGLLGLANNAELNLVWRNTFAGGLPTGLLLEVTGDRTATLVLPPTDRFRFDGVPPGTYTFALRAFNATGNSGASNAVTLTFPGSCSPPAVPTAFTASSKLHTVVLSWLPPAAGAAPSAYVVSVSGSLTGSFETTALGASGTLGAGTYMVSVQAVNVCGASPHTPAQTLTIP